jgi:hypothetical protein
MSRWVDLYPASWRNRYGEEMEWLLAERPPSPRDALDIARGALDAHLEPQLDGAPTPIRWTHRLPGIIALVGGAAWVAWSEAMAWDTVPLISLALAAFVVSVLGDYLHRFATPLGRWILGLVVSAFLSAALPWPLLVVPSIATLALAGAGLLALAAARAGIDGSMRRWLVALTVGPTLAIAVVGGLGLIASPDRSPLWPALVASYGVAWILVGVRMVIRGAPTFDDVTDGATA